MAIVIGGIILDELATSSFPIKPNNYSCHENS